jgi:hypothetical protein
MGRYKFDDDEWSVFEGPIPWWGTLIPFGCWIVLTYWFTFGIPFEAIDHWFTYSILVVLSGLALIAIIR